VKHMAEDVLGSAAGPSIPNQLISIQYPFKPVDMSAAADFRTPSGPSLENRVWSGWKLFAKRKPITAASIPIVTMKLLSD